jgi:hypothetical protein
MPDIAGGAGAAYNAAAQAGPEAPTDAENVHQDSLRGIYLKQAEESVAGIEATIEGLRESLKSAKAELKRLKDGGRV